MIKFMCDACGKDISDKIHSSIRQFYSRDHFNEELAETVSPACCEPSSQGKSLEDGGQNKVHLEVELLDEFLKLIHAGAWDMASAHLHCSQCAEKHRHRRKARVVTIFTKVPMSRRDS